MAFFQLLKGSLHALRQEVQSECSQLCNGFKTLTTVMSTFLQNSSKSAELTSMYVCACVWVLHSVCGYGSSGVACVGGGSVLPGTNQDHILSLLML